MNDVVFSTQLNGSKATNTPDLLCEVASTSLGLVRVDSSSRGIHSVVFDTGPENDPGFIAEAFPCRRPIEPDSPGTRSRDPEKSKACGHAFKTDKNSHASIWCRAVVAQVESPIMNQDPPPLWLHGTKFQCQVWRALLEIPCGETRSYTELAKMAGKPNAIRAAANACGKNPIAVLVPCHRVLRGDGGWGGYRWGVHRKQELLTRELEAVAADIA